LGNNRAGLKTYDGTFVTLNKNYPGLLTNGAPGIGASETFEIIFQCDTLKKRDN
jgi:hypothetical protein